MPNRWIEREQHIAENIEAARRRDEDARQLLVEYERKLAGAADQVRAMLDEARHDAERTKQQIVAEAKAAAQGEHERAMRDIRTATDAAVEELSQRSADLAVELAGKIISAKLTPDERSRLGAGFAGQVRRRGPQQKLTGKPRVAPWAFKSAIDWSKWKNPSPHLAVHEAAHVRYRSSGARPWSMPRRWSPRPKRPAVTDAVVQEFDSLVDDVLDRLPKLEAVLDLQLRRRGSQGSDAAKGVRQSSVAGVPQLFESRWRGTVGSTCCGSFI